MYGNSGLPRLLWMCIHPAQSHFHFRIRDNFPQIYVFSEQQQYNTTQQTSKWRRLIMLMMRLTSREKRKKRTRAWAVWRRWWWDSAAVAGGKIDKFHFEENLLKCDIFSASFTREKISAIFLHLNAIDTRWCCILLFDVEQQQHKTANTTTTTERWWWRRWYCSKWGGEMRRSVRYS